MKGKPPHEKEDPPDAMVWNEAAREAIRTLVDDGFAARRKTRARFASGNPQQQDPPKKRFCARCEKALDPHDRSPWRGYFCSQICAIAWWNAHDRPKKMGAPKKTHCKRGHKYDIFFTRPNGDKVQKCSQCQKAWFQKWYYAKFRRGVQRRYKRRKVA